MDNRRDSSYEADNQNKSVVSVGNWVVTMIVMAIPIVNFIMLFIWAFSLSTPKSKAKWAKASLLLMVIGIILVILFWGSIAALVPTDYAYE